MVKFPYHSILIVCSVNTARSRMAEGFLLDFFFRKKLDIIVKSGGISSHARDGMAISMDAKLAMKEMGIELSENALSVDLKRHPEFFENIDLILTLTEKHKKEIYNSIKLNSRKILTIKEFAGENGNIEDPCMKELEGFRVARDEIIESLLKGLSKYSF